MKFYHFTSERSYEAALQSNALKKFNSIVGKGVCDNIRNLAYQDAIFGLVEPEDPKWFAHEYIPNASLMECVLEKNRW